ncbi:hypothetical protein GCM10020229_34210 [Kitasatospora albolonga]
MAVTMPVATVQGGEAASGSPCRSGPGTPGLRTWYGRLYGVPDERTFSSPATRRVCPRQVKPQAAMMASRGSSTDNRPGSSPASTALQVVGEVQYTISSHASVKGADNIRGKELGRSPSEAPTGRTQQEHSGPHRTRLTASRWAGRGPEFFFLAEKEGMHGWC